MSLRWICVAAAVLTFAASASAGEKALMHCFAFTVVEDATKADWDAFNKATDELPGQIEGLNKVWRGKLRRPLSQYSRNGDRSVRQHAVCMEMKNDLALAAYAKHAAHAEWVKTYDKVRVPGTTTYDIFGE